MSDIGMKPIWYFVGQILVVMGALIFAAGIYQLAHPPETTTVLAETHPSIWWGGFMTAFGALLFWKSRK